MTAAISNTFSVVVCILMLAVMPVTAAVPLIQLTYDDGLVSLSAEGVAAQDVLEQLAGTAGVQVVITGPPPVGGRTVHWKRVPIQNAFEEVLRGTSFALVYPGIPGTDKRVHIFGKTGSLGGNGRSIRGKSDTKTEQSTRQGSAAYRGNTSSATKSGDSSSFAAEQTVKSHAQGKSAGTTASQNAMDGSGSASINVQTSQSSDTNAQSASSAENTASSSSDSALTGTALEKSRLTYQIEQIQSSIDSGEADRNYQFWKNTGKNEAYIYNPWKELARLQNELKATE